MLKYYKSQLATLDKFLLDMNMRSSLMLFSFVGIIGAAFWLREANVFRSNDPNPQKDAMLMQAVLTGLTRYHFQPKQVNDDFSKSVYNLYLKDVDANKRFLTQSDIDQLKPFELMLDDQAKSSSFEFFDMSVKMLDASLVKSQTWYREILAKPLDFNKAGQLEVEGKKLSWAKNDTELRQRWESWMKYEVLSRVTDEQAKQDKADFKGDKKSFETLEEEQRKKVLDTYDKWYKRLQKLDRDRRLEQYLTSFTNVFDPHSGYFSPKDKESFDIQMSGKLEGIGARLMTEGEKTIVSEIVVGGPAWKQGGLEAKDVILKVAQGDKEVEPTDIMGWDIDDVVSKVRGSKGTKVTLTIQKPDGTERMLTIVRDVVIMEEGLAKSLILNTTESAQDKIGLIYLSKFYADFTAQGSTSCAADVAKEVEKLKKENVKGIILDLRGNGGGSLRDVVTMSGLFIEQGPIVQVKSRDRKPEILADNDSRVQWGGPMIVMVNSYSASASEILAAALQDYKRAVIVGSNATYGKGTVQRFVDLDNFSGSAEVSPLGDMKLTIQKFYRVSGKTTQLDGVVPDIILPDFYNEIERGERENDYPLESNTIDAVPYSQQTYQVNDLDKLKSASNTRVNVDPTFKKITDNSLRLRKQRENTLYPLQLEEYRKWNKSQDEEAEQFENMFKPIDGFVVSNIADDLAVMQADTARLARNTDWIKDRKKDIQLFETMRIMQDMIRLDGVALKK